MAKKKLIRFRQMKSFPNVVEPPISDVLDRDHPRKGKWNEEFFEKDQPLVVELACGKGEYTVGMARRFPGKNFLGIDIKGARIWYGAKEALDDNIGNAGFLRTKIDFITRFFEKGEVSELWITFPDPQPEGRRERKRLTGPLFIDRYRKILKPGAKIHLKTDNDLFFEYTLGEIGKNGFILHRKIDDVYRQKGQIPEGLAALYEIQTHYEKQFSALGHTIKYLCFSIDEGPGS